MSTPWTNKRRDSQGGELAPLTELRREMERLFESFRHDPLGWLPETFASGDRLRPPADLIERDEDVLVRLEIPGVEPDDIDLTITGNTLTVSGEKKETVEQTEGGMRHIETHYGAFSRSITLPEGVDTEQVEAEYRNGVLNVRLKKTQEAKSRRIEVKAQTASSAEQGTKTAKKSEKPDG